MDEITTYIDIEHDKVRESTPQNGKVGIARRLLNGAHQFSYTSSFRHDWKYSTMMILFSVVTLQTISFAFAAEAGFPWHPIIIDLNNVLKYLSYGFTTTWRIDSNETGLIFGTVLVLTLAFVFSIVFAILSVNSEEKKIPFFSGLHYCCAIGFTVLYQPVVCILTIPLHCSSSGVSILGLECWTMMHILAVVVALMTTCIFIMFACYYSLTVLPEQSKKKGMDTASRLAAPHGRLAFLAVMTRSVVAFTFSTIVSHGSVANTSGAEQLLLTTLFTLTSISRLLLTLYYLPFYNRYANFQHLSRYALEVSAAVALCICVIFNDPSNTGGVFLGFIASPFFVFFVRILGSSREKQILGVPWSLVTSPYIAEVKLRLSCQPDAGQGPFETSKYRRRRIIHQDGPNTETSLDLNHAAEMYREVTNMGPFKRSGYLLLEAAKFFRFHAEDELTATRFFRRATQGDSAADVRYRLFSFQTQMEESKQGSSAQALSQVQFEALYRSACLLLFETYEKALAFWKMLEERDITMTGAEKFSFSESLLERGKIVQKCILDSKRELDNLVKNSNGSARALRLYAQFAKELLQDPMKAEKYERKAEALEAEMAASAGDKLVDDDCEFNAARDDASPQQVANMAISISRNQPNVTISGDEENLGEILSISASCCKLFGKRKRDVLGDKIDVLVPRPFSAAHGTMMHRYLDTTRPHILNKTRMVFGLHGRGYIFAVNLFVSPVTSPNGQLSFLGCFTPVVSNTCFILMKEDGTILGLTKSLFVSLGITRQEVENEELNVTQFLEPSVLSSSFETSNLTLQIDFTPRGDLSPDTVFRTTRMRIQIQSDSKNYPYDMSLVMLRMKLLSGDTEVTSVISQKMTSVPLGFAKAEEEDDEEEEEGRRVLSGCPSTITEEDAYSAHSGPSRSGSKIVSYQQVKPAKERSSDATIVIQDEFEGKIDSNNEVQQEPGLNVVIKQSEDNRSEKSSPGHQSALKQAGPSKNHGVGLPHESTVVSKQTKKQKFVSPSEIEERRMSSGHSSNDLKEDELTKAESEQREHSGKLKRPASQSHILFDPNGIAIALYQLVQSLGKTPDKQVIQLQRWFVLMISTISLIGIGVCVSSILSLQVYLEVIWSMAGSLQRSAWIMSISNEVLAMDVLRTWNIKPMNSPRIMERLNTTQSLLSSVRELHEGLSAGVAADMHYTLENEGSVRLISESMFQPNAISTLFVAGQQFIASSYQFLYELSVGDPQCIPCKLFVTVDGSSAVVPASNAVSSHLYQFSQESLLWQELYNILGLSVGMLFIWGVTVLKFRPIVIRIEMEKLKVSQTFLAIQSSTLKGIIKTTSLQLTSMRQLIDSLDDDEDDFDDSDYSDNESGMSSGTSPSTHRSERSTSQKLVQAKQNGKVKRIQELAPKSLKRKKRNSRPGSFSIAHVHENRNRSWLRRTYAKVVFQFITILRISYQLIILQLSVFLYFGGLFVVETEVDARFQEQSHHMLLSGQRLVDVQQLRHSLLEMQVMDPIVAINQSNAFIHRLRDLDYRLTVGGDDHAHGESTSEQLELAFVDGCTVRGESFCDIASEEQKEGLHLGFQHFLQGSQSLIESYHRKDSSLWSLGLDERYITQNVSDFLGSSSHGGNSTLRSPSWEQTNLQFFLDSEQTALVKGLQASFDIYVEQANEDANSFVTTRIGAVLAFGMLLFLQYWVIFRRLILRLDVNLKDVYNVFLLIPLNVVGKAKEIQPNIQNFLDSDESFKY